MNTHRSYHSTAIRCIPAHLHVRLTMGHSPARERTMPATPPPLSQPTAHEEGLSLRSCRPRRQRRFERSSPRRAPTGW